MNAKEIFRIIASGFIALLLGFGCWFLLHKDDKRNNEIALAYARAHNTTCLNVKDNEGLFVDSPIVYVFENGHIIGSYVISQYDYYLDE